MVTLNIYRSGNVHVLELFTILPIYGLQITTRRFLKGNE